MKFRLLKSGVKNRCSECGIEPIWNNKELILQIDHRFLIRGSHAASAAVEESNHPPFQNNSYFLEGERPFQAQHVSMNLTLKLKLACSPGASGILKETIHQSTSAFNRATKQAFEAKTINGVQIHKMRYHAERALTQLPAQLVCATLAKATEALASVRALQKKRAARDVAAGRNPARAYRCPQSERQAVRYDGKRASMVRLKEGWATLASVSGRQEVKFKLPGNFNRYADWKVCSSELVWAKQDQLFLHVVLEGDGKPFVPSGMVVGIDLGICRPAVMSTADGSFNRFLGKKEWRAIERRRHEYRRILQRKGTKPARRKLKALSGKVNRFRGDCDHVLSRQVVDSVPTGTTLVLENLRDIRERCGRGKGKQQNGRMHRWSFARLFGFIEYKARLAGDRVARVDPRNTSRRCSRCGDTRKRNRKSQGQFLCHECLFPLNADLNGARNIARKFASSGMPDDDGCCQPAQRRLTLERQAAPL